MDQDASLVDQLLGNVQYRNLLLTKEQLRKLLFFLKEDLLEVVAVQMENDKEETDVIVLTVIIQTIYDSYDNGRSRR